MSKTAGETQDAALVAAADVAPYVTLEQVAKQLNLPIRLLGRLRAVGIVQGYRFGHRTVRFLASEVQEQLRRFREGGVGFRGARP